MLILLDVTRQLNRALQGRLPTGVDRVGLAYVAHFRNRAQALVRFGGRWVVLDRDESSRLFDAMAAPDEGFRRMVFWLVRRAWLLDWRDTARGAWLFNTGHSGLDSPGYAHRVRRSGLAPLFFLHDLIPITHPEYARPGEAARHTLRLETILSVGRGVVVNSEDTRRELLTYVAVRGFQLPRCVVAPLAPPPLLASESARPLPAPYFVMLGTIEPRKNHLLLLHVWRELVAKLGDATPKLVIIGQRGWECEQVVDLLDRCEALRDVVIELPRCSDEALASWLTHAQALLFPSFVEGYGIPLVESLSLGTPVVASDLPVFREIAGEIPDYLDPLDGVGWRDAIVDYAQPDSTRRADQLGRMAGWQAPTWVAHFESVEALMAEIGRVFN